MPRNGFLLLILSSLSINQSMGLFPHAAPTEFIKPNTNTKIKSMSTYDSPTMIKVATVPSVHFSSTVTVRLFDEKEPTLRSNICPPVDGTYESPQPSLAQVDVASESKTTTNRDISRDRRIQQRISIAAILSFQNHLRKNSSVPSTHPDLLHSVSSKFSQRARDQAAERARLLYCEVYQPAKGTAVTIPLHISKFPAVKRKSDAARYDMDSSKQPEQAKRRCVIMP